MQLPEFEISEIRRLSTVDFSNLNFAKILSVSLFSRASDEGFPEIWKTSYLMSAKNENIQLQSRVTI